MRGFKRHASFIVTNVTYWAAMRSKSRECPLMTPATAWELLLWIIHFILIISSIIIVSLQLDSVAGKSAGSMTYIKFADLSVYRNHRLEGMCMQNAGCLASCSVQTKYGVEPGNLHPCQTSPLILTQGVWGVYWETWVLSLCVLCHLFI